MAWEDPISEPQIETITKAIRQRDIKGGKLSEEQLEFLLPEDGEKLLANLKLMNRKQASDAIGLLLACPFKPRDEPPTIQVEDEPEVEEVPVEIEVSPVQGLEPGPAINYKDEPKVQAGYFFIVDPTESDPDKVEKFFRVRHGKEGTRWEGWQFLEVQASDFFYPIKDQRRKWMILTEIAKDPVQAMNEYGMRLGRCGVCNRTLTDRHSILRGIGPICAERLGPTEEQEETLRRLGLIKD